MKIQKEYSVDNNNNVDLLSLVFCSLRMKNFLFVALFIVHVIKNLFIQSDAFLRCNDNFIYEL